MLDLRKMGIALQLYTVRDALEEDFRGTLRRVAAMGYEGVEFAGYGGIPAEEMRELLTELHLQAVGSHVSLQRLQKNLDEELAYMKAIGSRYIVCPALPPEYRSDKEGWQQVYSQFSEIGKKAQEQGLHFGYHNHAFEFEVEWDGQFAFDHLFESLAPEWLMMEMDAGWVQYAGQDPLAYIRKYSDRLPLLHIKDYVNHAQADFIDTVELGQGELPLHEIIKEAAAAKVEWLIVEQDRCKNPSIQAVETSIDWLKKNV